MMQLGLLVVSAVILLLTIFIATCLFSMRPIGSNELVKEYLSVGLRELAKRLKKEIDEIEERECLLRTQLAHLEALETFSRPSFESRKPSETGHLHFRGSS